jgi:hypothetical protein
MSLQEVLDSFSHIDLTEDEQMEALIWRKQKKASLLKQQEIERRAEENRKQLTKTQWGYEQTRSYMLYRGANIFDGGFVVDEANELIFNLLCYYFSNDPMFVSVAEGMGVKNPSLKKGIMLGGNFGVGKTTFMKLFMKNQRQVFHMHNAKKLADIYEKNGEEAIEEYMSNIKNALNDPTVFYHTHSGICIDDIGTENVKTNYGNKRNVIGDIIELRYERNCMGVFFHGTTNLTATQFTEFYGGRVSSRIRESVNFIELGGPDRRK